MLEVHLPFVFVERADSPNLNAGAAKSPIGAYTRTMTACFASVRRWNSDLSLHLVTNREPSESLATELEELRVSIDLIPFTHKPPPGYTDRFATSFFLLDAIQAARTDTLFLDPDIVCVRPITDERILASRQLGALPMPFRPDDDVNGLTLATAADLHSQLGMEPGRHIHYGGEALFVPLDERPRLVELIEQAWDLSMANFARGAPKFTTEEHVLSYALRNGPVTDLSDFIRRIWTASVYRTVDGHEDELTLWHLPAEKGRGFDELYRASLDRSGWFWAGNEETFIRECGKLMGLRNRPIARVARDLAGQLARRLHLR